MAGGVPCEMPFEGQNQKIPDLMQTRAAGLRPVRAMIQELFVDNSEVYA
jgi:hypothetical protein